MNFRNILTWAAMAVVAFVASAFAADTSGKILGTLKDLAGKLIPRAAAILTNKATGIKQTTLADGQGTFAFPVVPVGIYELLVGTENFQPYKSDIAIDLGSAVQVEVRPELAGVNENRDGKRGRNDGRDPGSVSADFASGGEVYILT